MALNISSQISPVQAILSASGASSTASSSAMSTSPVSLFTGQQASLIVNRASAEQRLLTYQETLVRAVLLERASWKFLSLQGAAPVLAEREVTPGDTSALSGTADDWTTPRTFGITVHQIASGQTVVSDELTAADQHGFGSGTESFRLTTNGDDYDMSVDLSSLDTNLEVLDAVADAFNNKANIGVYAEVSTDASTGEASLTLSTYGTGAEVAFTLSDQSATLLADIGLRTDRGANTTSGTGGVLTSAQDAEYAVDAGATQTSARNTIELFDGAVELTLTGTTSGEPTTVTVRPDVTEISTEIQGFVSTWNNQFEYLLANPGELTTPMAAQLNRSVQNLLPRMEQIGIERDAAGSLSVDRVKLDAAVAQRIGQVTSTMAGPTGLAVTARKISRDFLQAPATYLTHPHNPVRGYSLRSIQSSLVRGAIIDMVL